MRRVGFSLLIAESLVFSACATGGPERSPMPAAPDSTPAPDDARASSPVEPTPVNADGPAPELATAREAGSASDPPIAATVDGPTGDLGGPGAIETRYGRRWYKYAIVRKQSDQRIAYVEAELLPRLTPTGPLPDGTLLILELQGLTAQTPRAVAYRRLDNGVWAGFTYGTNGDTVKALEFPASTTTTTCNTGCHTLAPEHLSYLLPSLRRFLGTRRIETLTCPNSNGQTPCPPATYANGP